MGTFEFSEFSLSPRGKLEEPSSGGFELKDSWIGFEWKRDDSLSGEISFGSGDIIEPAIWYQDKTEDLALVEAAVKGRTPYFDIRAGLLSVTNGYEGSFPSWERHLPSTRVRSERWFSKRDFGIELRSETKPFLTSLFVRNGESGPNVDEKLWTTALWRVLTSNGYGILVTAEMGRTDPKSTSTSAAAIAEQGFDFTVLEPSKYRHGSLALFRKWNRHLVLFEGGRGEILQSDRKRPFAWGHADLCANLGGDLNLLFRYEQSQSDIHRTETIVKSTGFGFSVSSSDRLSSVTLWANKNTESIEQQNDQILLVFRLNSNSLQ